MNFKLVWIVVLFISVLSSSIVFAKTYDVESSGEYVMGDSDTKIEARRLALEHAKHLAPTLSQKPSCEITS